jgi:hypothetical protein
MHRPAPSRDTAGRASGFRLQWLADFFLARIAQVGQAIHWNLERRELEKKNWR